MPLVVDTYNVLHTVGILPADLAGIDVPGLIGLIQASRYRTERVELICDGLPRPDVPAGRVGSVIIRYAGGEAGAGAADALIALRIRHSTAPRRLIVVSSDQEVLRAARKRRCQTLTSAQFLHQLASDARTGSQSRSPSRAGASKPAGGLTNRQIDAWLSIFGVNEQEAAAIVDEAQSANSRGTTPSKRSAKRESKAKTSKRPARRGEVMPRDIVREAEEIWANRADPPGTKSD